MISSIKLKNFKCFKNERIPLSPLTVLSGVNSMGKSTVLQALRMLRQSVISNTIKNEGALLNGTLVSLGTADDVLYEKADNDDSIGVGLTVTDGNEEYFFEFNYSTGERILPNAPHSPKTCEMLLMDNFFYLQAERLGPRVSFPCSNYEVQHYNRIGNAGEFCAHLLSKYERSNICSENMLHESQPENSLRLQVEAWMSEIGHNLRIHLNDYPKMDMTNMEFSFLHEDIPSNNYRASNVGFGLTYSLPIFVSCLLCKPRGLILIENPEAHLHPRAQVAMGKFLAGCAANNIQIILETHSDHVLNGIRIAVKNARINPSDVALHFFHRSDNSMNAHIISPEIDSDGRLDQWPEGFFDSWETGLAELL
ncbi:MAG: DUF3696 domain-containing protein [Salinispira sp.]